MNVIQTSEKTKYGLPKSRTFYFLCINFDINAPEFHFHYHILLLQFFISILCKSQNFSNLVRNNIDVVLCGCNTLLSCMTQPQMLVVMITVHLLYICTMSTQCDMRILSYGCIPQSRDDHKKDTNLGFRYFLKLMHASMKVRRSIKLYLNGINIHVLYT